MPKSTKSSNVEVVDSSSSVEESEEAQFIEASKFDISKFYVKPIEEKMGTKSQYMAFPRYKINKSSKDGDSVIIVTKPIKITKGGIPKIDGEYRKSDADREFFWLGCDKEQPACVELFDALQQIDEVYSESIQNNSDTKIIYQNKDKKKEPLDKLEYVSLVRESSAPDNAKDSEKQYEPYNRIKVRFNTKWIADQEEGVPSEITTHLFLLEKEEPEPYTTVSDFEKSLRWGCEAQFVLSINKFWAMKALKNKKRECGFTVKCLQVYITKESTLGGGTSQVEKFKKRLFAPSGTPVVQTKPTKKEETSSDSDDEKPANNKTKKESNKVETKKVETKKVETESEESDSDSEEDKPKAKAKAKAKKVETESEESDSEEEKPKAKAKKVETESEESEDEKPKAKAKAKKVETESEESEDEKPKAKPKAKAKN
jgi:hypothetical protein